MSYVLTFLAGYILGLIVMKIFTVVYPITKMFTANTGEDK